MTHNKKWWEKPPLTFQFGKKLLESGWVNTHLKHVPGGSRALQVTEM